jgi:hypothetical protein
MTFSYVSIFEDSNRTVSGLLRVFSSYGLALVKHSQGESESWICRRAYRAWTWSVSEGGLETMPGAHLTAWGSSQFSGRIDGNPVREVPVVGQLAVSAVRTF